MMMRFRDEVVVVTGGGRGIGRACALRLAAEGADVTVADIDEDAAESVAEAVRLLGRRAIACRTDVSRAGDASELVQQTVEKLGRLDVLINNAAVGGSGASEDFPEEDWDRILDVNLKGTFMCGQAAARHMIAQGRGTIVNIASASGWVAAPFTAAYCASKGGVILLTQALGIEWARYGVRVVAVAPGPTLTELTRANIQRGFADVTALERRTPLGRLAEPDEIAKAVTFIASDEASYVTATTFFVDGGWSVNGSW